MKNELLSVCYLGFNIIGKMLGKLDVIKSGEGQANKKDKDENVSRKELMRSN